MPTEQEVEAQVMADYRAVAGKVVLVRSVDCADGDDVTVGEVICDPPLIARIRMYAESDTECIYRWMTDEHCDPTYRIDVLEPHPALRGLRPLAVFGTSRSTTGEISEADFTLADAELQARYEDARALTVDEIAGVEEGASASPATP